MGNLLERLINPDEEEGVLNCLAIWPWGGLFGLLGSRGHPPARQGQEPQPSEGKCATSQGIHLYYRCVCVCVCDTSMFLAALG
ncbi:hypothetical protein CDV31_002755 [Fusarium ambrosium]|uniref:Uncharacterized protein n=1 Tax=Fusarium ambrosium TaxID=131363 RepID=A0A428UW16_9HYPO|nr:hypothetical protein CDV31_002755 [Fusarium ambrosium]